MQEFLLYKKSDQSRIDTISYELHEGSGSDDVDYVYTMAGEFLADPMEADVGKITTEKSGFGQVISSNKNVIVEVMRNNISELKTSIDEYSNFMHSKYNELAAFQATTQAEVERRLSQLEKHNTAWFNISQAIKLSYTKLFSALNEQLDAFGTLAADNKIIRLNLRELKLKISQVNVSQNLKQCSDNNFIHEAVIFMQNAANRKYEKIIGSLENQLERKAELRTVVDLQENVMSNEQYIAVLVEKHKNLTFQLQHQAEALHRLEQQLPQDCATNINEQRKLLIKPNEILPSLICQCDGDWTIVQQRLYGDTGFNKSFEEYRWPFGKIFRDHWLGNEYLHSLTSRTHQMVRFDTWDIFGDYRVAYYQYFSLLNVSHAYRLNITGYMERISNLSNSMESHTGGRFSAPDRDEDTSSKHCARYYNSGWWFLNCMKINLNGYTELGMIWFDREKGDWIHLKRSRISITRSKIHPVI